MLGNSRGLSLYVLDHGGKVHSCTGVCLDCWPPLLVPKGSKVTVGKGLKGHVHWVVRGDRWQLTYNGWPVYTYVGDSGAHQHNGEGLYAFGGTWYLVSAAATSRASTPDKG